MKKITLLFALLMPFMALGQADLYQYVKNDSIEVQLQAYKSLGDSIVKGIELQKAELDKLIRQRDYLDSLLYYMSFKDTCSSDTVVIVQPDPKDTVVIVQPDPEGSFVNEAGTHVESSSVAWKRIRSGNIELENNTWGAGGGGYSSTIFTNADKSHGWSWETPSGLNNSVKMYLQSVVGHKPFWHYTVGEGFPFTANEVEEFKVSFKADVQATGKYNLAFEFWTVEDYYGDDQYINGDNHQNISGEYMFWMEATYDMPIKYREEFIGGWVWDIVESHDGNKWYVAFIPSNGAKIHEATIDFKPFMEWLVVKGLLDPYEKITNLELGNEVIEGSGTTTITDYKVVISK